MITVEASPHLIPALLARMAAQDRAAVCAYGGADMLAANIARSVITWCGIDAAGPVTLGGIEPFGAGDTGYLWQLITPAVRCHKRAYLHQSRWAMQRGLARFDNLIAIIEADSPAAQRHMRRLGWVMRGEIAPLVLFYERSRPWA